jgi:hypothetical protein
MVYLVANIFVCTAKILVLPVTVLVRYIYMYIYDSTNEIFMFVHFN